MSEEKIFKSFPTEVLKADSSTGMVEAIVSVMGNIDHTEDIIHNGAFTKTITERGNKIRVLDNHNSDSNRSVIAKVVSIKEIGQSELPPSITLRYPEATGGLYTVSQFDMEDDLSKSIFNKIKNGFIDEWSIAFTIPKGKSDISEKFINGTKALVRNIREIVLYEYSPVIWGANSATATLDAKSDELENTEEKRQSLMETYWNITDSFRNMFFDDENNSGFIAMDVYDDGTLICRAYNMEVNFEYYQLGWYEIDGQYAFDPMSDWLGGSYQFIPGVKSNDIIEETKAGKVLSTANFGKLSQASELLNAVISSATSADNNMSEDVELETNSEETEDLAKSQNALTELREAGLEEINLLLKTMTTGVH